MDIEGIAVSALTNRLGYTKNIRAFLAMHDDTPLWDGHIYIYKDESLQKAGITRVPAQVKGEQHNRIRSSKTGITYSIEIEDLKSYYADGGIMFFVVDIPDIPSAPKSIYYASLLPFDIYTYLRNAKGSKTVSFELSLLPDDKNIDRIPTIFSQFVKEKQRHAVLLTLSPEKIEYYKTNGKYPLYFEVQVPLKSHNILKCINEQNITFYAKVLDDFLVPIKRGKNSITQFGISIKKPVGVNGKLFYEEYTRLQDNNGKIILHFGVCNTFSYVLPKDNCQCLQRGSFNYERKGTLNQQIHDLSFCCQTIENKGFEIDGKRKELRNDIDITYILNDMRKELTFLENFREALNLSGFPEDMPIADFDANTWNLVNDFIAVFLEGKEKNFTNLPEGTYFCKVSFGSTTLALLVCKSETVCNIYNPYTHAFPLYSKDENGLTKSLSPFILLDVSLLSVVSFLDFDAIWLSLVSIEMSTIYRGYLTNFLLRILLAIDHTAPLRGKLLEFALKLAQWLCEVTANDIPEEREIALLNLFQTKMRMNDLTREDTTQLQAMLTENREMCDTNMVGYCILTGDFKNARKYFDLLPQKSQSEFWGYPIMHFWEGETRPSEPKGEMTEQNKDGKN